MLNANRRSELSGVEAAAFGVTRLRVFRIVTASLQVWVVCRQGTCRDFGWRIGSRRCPLLGAVAVGICGAKIVLGMLVEIFRCHMVAIDRGFPCQGDIPFKSLMCVAPALGVWATPSSVRRALLRLEWSTAVLASRRALVRS